MAMNEIIENTSIQKSGPISLNEDEGVEVNPYGNFFKVKSQTLSDVFNKGTPFTENEKKYKVHQLLKDNETYMVKVLDESNHPLSKYEYGGYITLAAPFTPTRWYLIDDKTTVSKIEKNTRLRGQNLKF
jgi:hypothetical protein